MSKSQTTFCVQTAALAFTLSAAFAGPAFSAERVLYSFPGGSAGANPTAGLIVDTAGNLYGTTNGGGDIECQCGTVFTLSPEGVETVLYAFKGGADGEFPYSGAISDETGTLYGITTDGGAFDDGTVFSLTASGSESILYSFQGGSDGWFPHGTLVRDASGNLYGTTTDGGNFGGSECAEAGCGTVFEIKPDQTKVSLYAFQGGSDGAAPVSGVIRDSAGNLYGTTLEGGVDCDGEGVGCGTVFKVALNGTESILHSFQGGTDGRTPYAGLVSDGGGNLFGTTAAGGSGCGESGCGTVFKIAPDGTETILHSFQGGADGYVPEASVILDSSGNLYGTTYYGGGKDCKRNGCGTVFKLAPDGTETILASFDKGGKNPAAPLLLRRNILYGTTLKGGGHRDGVVFKVRR